MVQDRPTVGLSAVLWQGADSIHMAKIHPTAAFCGGGFGSGSSAAAPNNVYLGMPVVFDLNLVTFTRQLLAERMKDNQELHMIDVGANTGPFTLLASSLPLLHVHAIEPVYAFSRTLAANVRLNRIEARVNISVLAASKA